MTTARPLLIVGAGGFAREAAACVRAINDVRPTWELLGHLDDDPSRHGSVINGVRVLGPVEAVAYHPEAWVLLGTGRPADYTSRLRLAERLDLPRERYATLVHPSGSGAASSRIGVGTVLLAHVDLTVDVVIGDHVAVMPQVVLTHDVEVEDWVTIAAGVRVGGGARLRRGAYIGSAVSIREGVEIGDWALVGMGSVVTRDVPAARLWYGAPARDRSAAPVSARISSPADSRRIERKG